jgi:hypothetical protein
MKPISVFFLIGFLTISIEEHSLHRQHNSSKHSIFVCVSQEAK